MLVEMFVGLAFRWCGKTEALRKGPDWTVCCVWYYTFQDEGEGILGGEKLFPSILSHNNDTMNTGK